MNSDQSNASSQSVSTLAQGGSVGRGLWILMVVAILAGGAGAYLMLDQSETEDDAARTGVPAVAEKSTVKAPSVADRSASVTGQDRSAPRTAPDLQRPTTPAVRGPTSEDYARQGYARELLAELLEIKPVDGKIRVAQIGEINKLLGELRQQGAAALPAIREYLEAQKDIDFSLAVNPKGANYATLRIGLIDALGHIGGLEAQEVLVQTLEVSAAPKEIAMLARGLERQAGSEYRPEIQAAALDTLDLMMEGEGSETDEDVGFLFAVLGRYGDDSLADVMEQTYPRWSAYSSVTLAKVPNGEGVPALVRLAQQNPETGRDKGSALQMLAQGSREHPEAAEALIQMAEAGEFTNASWRSVAKTLGGEEYRFRSELFEQTGRSPARLGKPSTSITGLALQAHHRWSDAEIDQRIELIDQLSRVAPPDTTDALERSWSRLSSWRQKRLAGEARRTR